MFISFVFSKTVSNKIGNVCIWHLLIFLSSLVSQLQVAMFPNTHGSPGMVHCFSSGRNYRVENVIMQRVLKDIKLLYFFLLLPPLPLFLFSSLHSSSSPCPLLFLCFLLPFWCIKPSVMVLLDVGRKQLDKD